MQPPASSPCLADEFNPAHVDLEQTHGVTVWRKATRLGVLHFVHQRRPRRAAAAGAVFLGQAAQGVGGFLEAILDVAGCQGHLVLHRGSINLPGAQGGLGHQPRRKQCRGHCQKKLP